MDTFRRLKVMSDRHIIFSRHQLLAVASQLKEFEDLVGIDYVFTDDGEPIRMEYLWADEE